MHGVDTRLLHHQAGVNGQGYTGDISRIIRSKPEHRVGDVLWLHPRYVQQVQCPKSRRHFLQRRVRLPPTEQGIHRLVLYYWRIHGTRMHRIDPDTVRRKLYREDSHQANYSVVGRAVVSLVCQPLQACDGRGYEDHAGVPLDHVRYYCFAALPHPGQAHGYHLVPLLVRQLPGLLEALDPGVCQQDIDVTEVGDRLFDDPLHLVAVAYVGLHRQTTPVETFDHPGSVGEVLGACQWVGDGRELVGDVADDYLCTFA